MILGPFRAGRCPLHLYFRFMDGYPEVDQRSYVANVPAEDIDEFRSYVDKLILPSGSFVGSAAYGAALQDVHNNAKTMINDMRGVFSGPAEGEECPSEE